MNVTSLTSYQAVVVHSRAHRVIKDQLGHALREYGITMMQWSIIGLLADAGSTGLRISDLAKMLDTSLAFITTSVNVLEAKRYVRRTGHGSDNRAKLVRLDENFAPKVAEIENDISTHQAGAIFQQVDPQDLHVYMKVLTQIAAQPHNL